MADTTNTQVASQAERDAALTTNPTSTQNALELKRQKAVQEDRRRLAEDLAQTRARREIVHIFRVYPPAQRRVRLSSIESFVLNATTAADEQRRPREINSCFYKTPESLVPCLHQTIDYNMF